MIKSRWPLPALSRKMQAFKGNETMGERAERFASVARRVNTFTAFVEGI